MDNIKKNYKILICGDSIAKGIIFDKEKEKYIRCTNSCTEILKNKLNAILFNTASFGNTVLRGSKKFLRDIVSKDPDIVALEFGGNDCDFDWSEVAEKPFEKHLPKTDFITYENQLYKMVNTIYEKGIVPVLISMPPIDPERFLDWVSQFDSEKKNNILKWLGFASKMYWWQERYNSAILKVAQKTNTKLIDVRNAFLSNYDFRDYICIDGIHPNEKGHKLIAAKIEEYLKDNYSFVLV